MMIVESAALLTLTGIAQIVAIPTSPTVQVGISGLYGVMPVSANTVHRHPGISSLIILFYFIFYFYLFIYLGIRDDSDCI